MEVNSSSSSNDSLNNPSRSHCFFYEPISLIFTIFSITTILLFLPLYVFVLYLGFQRWWQQRSSSSSSVMSHTDSFTYNLTSIELIGVLGFVTVCCAIYLKQLSVFECGYSFMTFNWLGQTFFHILTCVERYLAVVHPVTYLGLRRERGVRIRNVSVGCAWLLCFGGSALHSALDFPSLSLCLLIFSVVVISFCSLSVLYVLIGPGPGEQGGRRERVDQSKQRAFYTILTILGVLVLRCAAGLAWAVLKKLVETNDCLLLIITDCLNVPSSLVLPLLFLIRAGKLTCCKNSTQ